MEQQIAPLFLDYDQRRKAQGAQAADALDEGELVSLEEHIVTATNKHNEFLKELGLPLLPLAGVDQS